MKCIQCEREIKDGERVWLVYNNDRVHMDCMGDFLREHNKVTEELSIKRGDNLLDMMGEVQKEIDTP